MHTESLPQNLLQSLPKVRGRYKKNASLSGLCWFKTGGEASVMYTPADTEDLAKFLRELPSDIEVAVLGAGSNLLIRDGGFAGVIVRLGRNFNYIEKTQDAYALRVGAFTPDMAVATFAAELGIGGLEFLSGIPGTVGGALTMNAGAYGTETKDVLKAATAVTMKGELIQLSQEEIGHVYRGHSIQEDIIFVEAILEGYQQNRDIVQGKIERIKIDREMAQPIYTRTGGSTFKNPKGAKAWKLIEGVGLRGYTIDGAKISEKHCNFIENFDDATSADIEALIKLAHEKVKERYKLDLECEIRLIGKEAEHNEDG